MTKCTGRRGGLLTAEVVPAPTYLGQAEVRARSGLEFMEGGRHSAGPATDGTDCVRTEDGDLNVGSLGIRGSDHARFALPKSGSDLGPAKSVLLHLLCGGSGAGETSLSAHPLLDVRPARVDMQVSMIRVATDHQSG